MQPYLMVNWSGQPVVAEHMLVMRAVAAQMLTGIIDAARVDFIHDLCEGRVTKKKRGIFGSTGGTFFFGDFGQVNEQPHTVEFFIPRGGAHHRFTSESLVISRTYDVLGNAIGYPEDVDVEAVRKWKIRITNKVTK